MVTLQAHIRRLLMLMAIGVRRAEQAQRSIRTNNSGGQWDAALLLLRRLKQRQ